MKRNYVVLIVSLLVFSMLSVVSASAANNSFVFRANGTIDRYDKPGYDGAIITSGSWNIKIGMDSRGVYFVEQFNAHYQELNMNEETPGTRDNFELYLTAITSVDVTGEVCTIVAHLWDNKKGWSADGKPLFTTQDLGPVTITIQRSGIYFQAAFPYIGSTLSLQTK